MVGYQLHPTDLARVVGEPCLKRLICAICKHVAREPRTSQTCDHRFCVSCLEDMLQNGAAKCPEDGKQLCQSSLDDLARCEVVGLAIHCTFMDDGCKWKGDIRNLEMHVEKYHQNEQQASANKTPNLHKGAICRGEPPYRKHAIFQLSGPGPCVDRSCDGSTVETPHGAEQPQHLEDEQAQFVQRDESDQMKRELAHLSRDIERLQRRMQMRQDDESDQMKTEIAKLRRDVEQLQIRMQVLEENSPKLSPPPQHVCEQYQARVQAVEEKLAVFFAALENEKRDRTRELAAQRNSCEAFHDECVAERERASDDRDMEVALLQNSQADLEARVRRLERD